jgi:hypothetical protein
MPELTPNQRKLLREALVSSYRKPETLRLFVSDNFEGDRLTNISFQTLAVAADDLITKFQELGDVRDLVEALIRERPRNPKVQSLKEQILPSLQVRAELRVLETQVPPERVIEGQGTCPNSIVVREAIEAEELIEPLNYAHLVVAVFWEGERKLRKFRVCPKLCYRDKITQKVVHRPLATKEGTDQYSVFQNKIPEFLKKLHAFGIMELRRLFPDVAQSWRLSIELFLPVDLLCLPLAAWCGQDGDFFSKHPIVVGCSDRFDPTRPDQAIELHNQLQLGWERFRKKVPDRVGSTLRNLDWLDSNQAQHKSLAAYAGFRCYGNWLVPGEWEKLDPVSQKRWQDLVGFGIPLALWICEGNPPTSARKRVFNRLASGTRFELLEEIPIMRDAQWKMSEQCVGVFYEDLNYMPELPNLREQSYFSWPGFESA